MIILPSVSKSVEDSCSSSKQELISSLSEIDGRSSCSKQELVPLPETDLKKTRTNDNAVDTSCGTQMSVYRHTFKKPTPLENTLSATGVLCLATSVKD